MGRACFSLTMQRAMRGLCVAWKPLMAPQAMEMNIMGNTGLVSACGWWFDRPSHTSGMSTPCTTKATTMATAMASSRMPKTG